MQTNKHYFFVGLFVLAAAVAGIVFSLWLTSHGKGDYRHYRIRFAESVSGLSLGSAVKFHGIDVGHVTGISIDPSDIRLICVEVDILDKTPVKADTVASLKLQGITGVVFIDLNGGSQNLANLSDALPKDVVPVIQAERSSLGTLADNLPQMIQKATLILDQLSKIVDDQNVAEFKSIAEELDTLLKNGNSVLKDSSRDIKEITAHLNASSEQADLTMGNLQSASRNLNSLSESLKEKPSRLLFPDKDKGVPAP